MKTIIKLITVLTIGLIFVSCKKEDNQPIAPNGDAPVWVDTTVVVTPPIDSTLTYRFKVTGADMTNNIQKMVIVNGNMQLLTNNNTINITCNHGDVIDFKLIYMYPDQYGSSKWINVELEKNGNGNIWNIYNWINYYSPTGSGSENYTKTFTAYY